MRGGYLLRTFAVECSLAASLFAVGPTGTIVGTVFDPSGAVVPKARITVRNQETNATREVVTTEDGDYNVPLLPPALYQVTVEKAGFRRSVYGDVNLDVDQTARVDFTLQVGGVNEEVAVTDTVPLVQTDTSTLGQVIDRRQVRELPLNERNFLSLVLLVAGGQPPAEGSQNSTQGGAISVNGAREQSNNFLLDGVDNNDPYINQYVVLPSIDAIQEFKVQSSDYSAEFGRGGGAQINVVLRNGSNRLHGSVFEFFRNRNLDAKNFFDLPYCTPASPPGTCGEIPRFDRNQFGGTLGGPIRRDKTFFFVSYEGLRLRQATTRQATVPSQMERAGILAMVPPPYRNPAGEAVFNLLPAANVGPDLATSNTFTASPVIRNSVNSPLIKLDHRAGANDSITGHYAVFDENRFNPFDPVNAFTNLPGYGSFTLNHAQNTGLSWTHILNSRLVNELRFGFNRLRAAVLQEHHGTNESQALGFPTVLTNPVDLGFPNVSILAFDGIGEPINYPQDRHDNTFHLADNLAWNYGRHQFKFGADIRRMQLNSYIDFLARGEWFFLGGLSGDPMQALAQLLSGMPDYAVAVKGDTFNGLRSTGLNYYIQDDIRVVPRLLLNVGLRYEYNSPPVEIHDRFSVPDLSSASVGCSPKPDCQFIRAGTDGVPRATYNKDLNNFAPRIGVAWRPLKSERWVVRSAYGIFYDVGILNINIFPRTNPPFYEIAAFLNSGTNVIQDILSQPGLPQVQPNVIARDLRDAYMQQWNVDLQYELRPNWMMDLAYVGSKGTHLPSPRDLNQARPDTGAVAYPQFSSILYVSSDASSSYNGLQFRSERRVSQGLAFLAAYTFSKSLDNDSAVFSGSVGSGLPQDSQNLRAERGLSDFQTHHRFAFSYLYDLPFGGGRRWLNRPGLRRHLLGNWQLAGILTLETGHPFTVNLPSTQTSTAITAFGVPARPDLIADPFRPGPVPNNPDAACQTTQSQGGRAADEVKQPQSWFNPCAFTDPSPGSFGNAGRNILIGPGLNNLDFSLSKSISFRKEGRRLQLRAELFNLFNHPNFDIPSHTLDAPTFGMVLSANAYGSKPPRQVQLGLRYAF
ncbi:MAG: TonB-dependent receptor [Bryobacteraceae bacterium]|jgi:hypothetical protein